MNSISSASSGAVQGRDHGKAAPSLPARLGPGLLLCAALAAASMWLAGIGPLQRSGISALTIAIVLGIVAGNTVYGRIAPVGAAGVGWSKQYLLRFGIILYGFRLTFQDIGHIGAAGVVIDVLVVASTFALSWLAGVRLFRLQREDAMLIGAGSAICGAAAVMAAQSVVRGRAEQVTVAVSTVVAFGTAAMFLYPVMLELNAQWGWIPLSAAQSGLYIGSTVHEVAQVAAAAASLGSSVADTAVITKMVRVMLLAPFLMVLAATLCRRPGAGHAHGADGESVLAQVWQAMPWFALGFIAAAGVNSLHVLPAPAVAVLDQTCTVALAMAMAALGLSTHVSALRRAGKKPLLLAALLFAWLIVGGGAIGLGVTALMG
ncbi:YeiH family protein [Pigmentiphaga soli]|uniref:YeiH family protein n=1 Tax=Pigmentiphaga soli TaxID=1007095 RepID=A0ABP8GMB1_9BURK